VGHRVVTGGATYHEPHRVTREMLDELRRISTYAPVHLPYEIDLIDLMSERVPGLPQVACFDTRGRAVGRRARFALLTARSDQRGELQVRSTWASRFKTEAF